MIGLLTMVEPVTIMILAPMKQNDPLQYTYMWAQKAISMANSMGYNVKVLEKEDVTYDNVSKGVKEWRPRYVISFSHGCPLSIQGQNGCCITRKYSTDELVCMASGDYGEDTKQKVLHWLNPMGKLSCPGICKLEIDPCSASCTKETNVGILKGTIVDAVACHTANQLGKCATNGYGIETWIGMDDILMFPVDSEGSQDIFGDIQLIKIRELLLGKTVFEAERIMSEEEDKLIRKYKPIKYMSLPMLWNKLNRRVLGKKSAMIYENLTLNKDLNIMVYNIPKVIYDNKIIG